MRIVLLLQSTPPSEGLPRRTTALGFLEPRKANCYTALVLWKPTPKAWGNLQMKTSFCGTIYPEVYVAKQDRMP